MIGVFVLVSGEITDNEVLWYAAQMKRCRIIHFINDYRLRGDIISLEKKADNNDIHIGR